VCFGCVFRHTSLLYIRCVCAYMKYACIALIICGHVTYLHPPDSIHDVCSLPDCQISGNCFNSSFNTNIQNPVLDRMLEHLILRTRLCGTGFIAQPGWLFHFRPTKIVGQKYFYLFGTSSQRANGRGCPFNIFKWFVGLGGSCLGVITV